MNTLIAWQNTCDLNDCNELTEYGGSGTPWYLSPGFIVLAVLGFLLYREVKRSEQRDRAEEQESRRIDAEVEREAAEKRARAERQAERQADAERRFSLEMRALAEPHAKRQAALRSKRESGQQGKFARDVAREMIEQHNYLVRSGEEGNLTKSELDEFERIAWPHRKVGGS